MGQEQFLDIWEDIKNMGVIIGKAGLHGNVSMRTGLISVVYTFVCTFSCFKQC